MKVQNVEILRRGEEDGCTFATMEENLDRTLSNEEELDWEGWHWEMVRERRKRVRRILNLIDKIEINKVCSN